MIFSENLELSRLESVVLGNALDGVPKENDQANNSKIEDPSKMTADEKNEVEEKVGEAIEENISPAIARANSLLMSAVSGSPEITKPSCFWRVDSVYSL